jgi:hypothetical protein
MRLYHRILIVLIAIAQSLLPVTAMASADAGGVRGHKAAATGPAAIVVAMPANSSHTECPMHRHHRHSSMNSAVKAATQTTTDGHGDAHAGCCGHAQCSCGGTGIAPVVPADIAALAFPRMAASLPASLLAQPLAAHTPDRLRPPIRA